jgi:GntR family transcriptional regulator, transcriptional repressor for pyruvate dehydrogenase complex
VEAATKTALEVVRRDRLYKEVSKQVERLILNGLKPGDRLPGERKLAEILGVSRGSLRDALVRLEVMGLVESRPGTGTRVRELSVDELVVPLANVVTSKVALVGDLLDFRKMLEPSLAARAARHASRSDIAYMEQILMRQDKKIRAGKLAIEEDSEFHYHIALASGNRVVLKVLDVLMDLLRGTRERSLQTEGRARKSFAGHRSILAAIKRRDPLAADRAMRRHVKAIEKLVLSKL